MGKSTISVAMFNSFLYFLPDGNYKQKGDMTQKQHKMGRKGNRVRETTHLIHLQLQATLTAVPMFEALGAGRNIYWKAISGGSGSSGHADDMRDSRGVGASWLQSSSSLSLASPRPSLLIFHEFSWLLSGVFMFHPSNDNFASGLTGFVTNSTSPKSSYPFFEWP